MDIKNKQPDLLYMQPILVTSGGNANKDFFIPQELFAALKTPLYKPVDWEHHADEDDDKTEIIGTIIDSWFEDLEGEKLKAEKFEDMPTEFNLVTNAAIWRYLFQTRAEEIEKRFEDDDLFVSMEAWFLDYDYVIKEGKEFKVVKRNKSTAVLDKYLLSNGGNGNINGKELYRAPRNIIFGGMGIVKNPANKRSEVKEIAAKSNKMVDTIVSTIVLPVKKLPNATRLLEKILFD